MLKHVQLTPASDWGMSCCSYCSDQSDCVTSSGNWKIFFGNGIKLTVESSEYSNINIVFIKKEKDTSTFISCM